MFNLTNVEIEKKTIKSARHEALNRKSIKTKPEIR